MRIDRQLAWVMWSSDLANRSTSNTAGPASRGIGLPGQQGRATWTAGPGYLDRGAGLPGPRGRATWTAGSGYLNQTNYKVQIINIIHNCLIFEYNFISERSRAIRPGVPIDPTADKQNRQGLQYDLDKNRKKTIILSFYYLGH